MAISETLTLGIVPVSQAAEQYFDRDLGPAAASRFALAAGSLMLMIAPVDYYFRGSYAMLYVVPVIMLAGQCSPAPVTGAAAAIGLIYGIYFLKAIYNPPPVNTPILGTRLVNRTLVALMILWFTWTTRLWNNWQAAQADAELPDSFHHTEREFVPRWLSCVACRSWH